MNLHKNHCLRNFHLADDLEKAFAVFQEMELNDVQPDAIACSALMRAFNRGCQPSKVILIAEFMRDKAVPFIDANFFEMVSACSMYVFTLQFNFNHTSVGFISH